jgi:hypothetical protein
MNFNFFKLLFFYRKYFLSQLIYTLQLYSKNVFAVIIAEIPVPIIAIFICYYFIVNLIV